MQAMGSEVFVVVRLGALDVLRVLTNAAFGLGPFDAPDVAQDAASMDILLDPVSADLILASDSGGSYFLRQSTDGGTSWLSAVTPPGDATSSDWALGGSSIYVSGVEAANDLEVIPLADLTTSVNIAGLPTARNQERAVSADTFGNGYFATAVPDGRVELDRVLAGSGSVDGARTLDPNGRHPGLIALPTDGGAIVVYTRGGNQVWAATEVY